MFDIDDTLLDFQAGNRNAVNRLMDELGYYHPDRYDQYEKVNLKCWAELEKGQMTQAQLRMERFLRFFNQYPVSGDPSYAAERFVELLGEQSIMLPYSEEVVTRIAEKLPVVIVTNGITSIQKNRLVRSPLRNLVTHVIISEEVGCSKPRPEIFWLALNSVGAKPQDALMIGDSVNSDILGGNNAGIDACWFNPTGNRM